LEVLITDQHSYRNASPFDDPELDKLTPHEFIGMFQEEAAQILDGGRAYNGGRPPARLTYGGGTAPHGPKAAPPQPIPAATAQAGRAAADHPGGRAEGLVQGAAAGVDGDLEDLGQLRGRAGPARRPAESAGGHGPALDGRVRDAGRRRLRQRLDGAGGDL